MDRGLEGVATFAASALKAKTANGRFWLTWDVFVDHVEEILPHFPNGFLFITPPSEPHL